jgi:hypothetical protein
MLSYSLLQATVGISRSDTAVDEALFPGPLGPLEEDLMPGTLSFAEMYGQHVELLPARTILSLVSTGGHGGGSQGDSGHGGDGDGAESEGGHGGIGGTGGAGGAGIGGLGANL